MRSVVLSSSTSAVVTATLTCRCTRDVVGIFEPGFTLDATSRASVLATQTAPTRWRSTRAPALPVPAPANAQ
jgi:hypothetical protein